MDVTFVINEKESDARAKRLQRACESCKKKKVMGYISDVNLSAKCRAEAVYTQCIELTDDASKAWPATNFSL